jgi:solute carrier family 25 carnitine/acylcarnitine transporter 20/29
MDTFDDFKLLNNNYVKGALSGMFGILLSQPVDAIKTHYQVNKNIKFNYSLKNLYKGVMSPLLGVGLEKAVVFGTYNYLKNQQNCSIAVSGGISGFIASAIVSPYERIKILTQTNKKITKEILKPSYLFKGLSATFTREIPGFAIYFSTYEYLKNKFYTEKNKEISIYSSFIFGGISGSTAWLFIYPQDRIKTIIQSSDSNQKLNIKSIIKKTYEVGGINNLNNTNSVNKLLYGIKHFYSGFSFAIIRAIFLHSGTFCMMEILNKQ